MAKMFRQWSEAVPVRRDWRRGRSQEARGMSVYLRCKEAGVRLCNDA